MDGDPPDLRTSGKRPGSATNFKAFRALGQVATAIARTAASAIALVEDAELRKKASDIVIGQANKGFHTVKQGVAHGAGSVGQRIQAGPRQVSAVLASLQKRMDEQRLANALREERDAPVDVQIGPQLYEGAHQELRRRLWVALLDNASLSHSVAHSALSPNGSEAMGSVCQSPGRVSFRGQSGVDGLDNDLLGSPSEAARSATAAPQQLLTEAEAAAPLEGTSAGNGLETESQAAIPVGQSAAEGADRNLAALRLSSGSQGGAPCSSDVAGTPSPMGSSPRLTGCSWASRQADSGQTEVVRLPSPTAGETSAGVAESTSPFTRQAQDTKALTCAEGQGSAEAPSTAITEPHDSSHAATRTEPSESQEAQRVSHDSSPAQEAESHPESPVTSGATPSVPPPSGAASSGASAAGFRRSQRGADDDAWEMVQEGSGVIGFDCTGLGGASLRLHPSQHDHLSAEDVAVWQKLMIAISTVPPVSTEYAEDSRYNTLLQISIGQEETDDIIARDINRTFPEHPQFGYEQGQRALFRVLKAYSLHDLEVQYCQGMGFVAGVVLMYLPEEPAFRMLTRLLDQRGPNLRRLYLPALEGLKHQLRCLEWLLERHSPLLAIHLKDNMVTPVLYASQWFLTLFACPFPSAFCARIIDIILVTGNTDILLQTALAVVLECEAELLDRSDFEDILTYLKVEPVQWKYKRLRQVLNTAVATVVTPDMVRAADFAVSEGYCGSLIRRNTSGVEFAAASSSGGGCQSRSHSVVSAAILPSKAQADGEGVSAAEVSAALHDMGSSQDVAGDATAMEAPLAAIGADDLEMVLAVEMLRAPSDHHLSSEQRHESMEESSSSQTH